MITIKEYLQMTQPEIIEELKPEDRITKFFYWFDGIFDKPVKTLLRMKNHG